jgi:hypothetical protein
MDWIGFRKTPLSDCGKSNQTMIARARNSGNAPNWSSTNSLNVSSGMMQI